MADKYEKIAWWILGIIAAAALSLIGFALWIVYTLVMWVTSK